MVKVGSARRDENGNGRGGQPGNQDGFEVCTEKWYKNKKGWNIIRAYDDTIREKLAYAMQRACDNDNIGYDKSDRYTAYNWCKKYNKSYDPGLITEPVEVDCSALVRLCCAYAGIMVGDFYTGSEISVLYETGKFDIITDTAITEVPDYLMRGDILVTKTVGHTAIVLNDGDKTIEAREVVGIATAKQAMRARSAANLNSEVVGVIKKDEQVKVVEIYSNGWYKIKFNGGYAYTSNSSYNYYTFVATHPVKYITTGNVYIRKGPSTQYNTCGSFKKGVEVEIGPIVNNWGVLADGRGYVSMKYLRQV